jgi:uncharacterized protein YjbI with pentapeptide repeats
VNSTISGRQPYIPLAAMNPIKRQEQFAATQVAKNDAFLKREIHFQGVQAIKQSPGIVAQIAKLDGPPLADFLRENRTEVERYIKSLDHTGDRLLLCKKDLNRASLSGLYLKDVDFTGANLQGAAFSGSDTVLLGAIFSKAQLQGADFRNTNLIEQCKFNGAHLEEADFRGADLCNASLINAVVDCDTDFSGADLRGADFRGVNLKLAKRDDSTNFEGVILSIESDFLPDGYETQNVKIRGGGKGKILTKAEDRPKGNRSRPARH